MSNLTADQKRQLANKVVGAYFGDDAPIPGKQYALTGQKGDKCIMNGNTWAESEVSKCNQCGDSNDLLTQFTKHNVCGKCTRLNQKNI